MPELEKIMCENKREKRKEKEKGGG